MFEQFVTDLTHIDPAVRYEAAQKLGASNDARAIQPLIAALPDTNSKVQYAAFSGLIKLGASEAAAPILDLLIDNPTCKVWELLKLNIGMRLRAGLLEMAHNGNAEIADQLVHALETRDLDEHQRALFVRMLGRAATADRVDLLLDLLHSDSTTMQGAAAEALGYVGDQRAIESLLVFLGDSPNELREIAAEALGRIGHGDAFEPLIALLKDENEWVRRAACAALGEIADHRAVEPLTDLLKDDSSIVQDAAFDALKKLSFGKYDLTL